jgi:hypothetical protein
MARQRLNQAQLSALVRWTPGYLQRRITGAVPWSTDDLDEVASALGVDARQLVAPRVLAG